MAGRLWRIRDVVSRWISTSLDLPFYGTVRGRNRTVSESTRKRGQPCGLQRVHFGVCLFVCVCVSFSRSHTHWERVAKSFPFLGELVAIFSTPALCLATVTEFFVDVVVVEVSARAIVRA